MDFRRGFIDMNIWEIELDKFPFGWQKILDGAKKEYPYGVFVTLNDDNNSVTFSSEFRENDSTLYNPIEYKKLLHKHYNMLCNEAKQLLQSKNIDIARLFTIDFLLWGIVWDYTKEPTGENEDYKMYDPRMFSDEQSMWKQYEDFEDYFSFKTYELLDEVVITKFTYIKLKNEINNGKYIPHNKNLSLE